MIWELLLLFLVSGVVEQAVVVIEVEVQGIDAIHDMIVVVVVLIAVVVMVDHLIGHLVIHLGQGKSNCGCGCNGDEFEYGDTKLQRWVFVEMINVTLYASWNQVILMMTSSSCSKTG